MQAYVSLEKENRDIRKMLIRHSSCADSNPCPNSNLKLWHFPRFHSFADSDIMNTRANWHNDVQTHLFDEGADYRPMDHRDPASVLIKL